MTKILTVPDQTILSNENDFENNEEMRPSIQRTVGGALFFVAALLLLQQSYFPHFEIRQFRRIFSPSNSALNSHCHEFLESLQKQKVPTVFQKIEIQIRDASLKTDRVIDDLKSCFAISPKSQVLLELEVFSSDFGNLKGNDLQVQGSVFDLKSKNKIAEVGFWIEHKSKE